MSDSKITFDPDSQVSYEPWEHDGAVGFACTPNGADEPSGYVYLNPSTGSDDGVPSVFLYAGPAGDPAQDAVICFVEPGVVYEQAPEPT